MAKIDWMKKVSTLKGAVNEYRDIHESVIQTASPSLNFIYGNGWGLPRGYSVMMYGPPKSGKSIITYLMAGGIHRDYPEGWVIKFNTEFREQAQLPPSKMPMYGIDQKRWKAVEANNPEFVYNQITGEIDAWCKDGFPLVAVILDSMNGVQGRRQMASEKGVMQQQIGDVAATNKEGLKAVLEVQRRHNFALIMTTHVGIEMDPIEQKRGNKFRMGAGIGCQHHGEYFMYVEANRNKAGRADMTGTEFVNPNLKDMNDDADRTAHKIRCVMKDATMGPKGRMGEFTFDYQQGVINQHEEVYLLGYNRGAILKDGGHYYTVPGIETPQCKGEANFLNFLKTAPQVQEHILKELKRQDLTGASKKADAKAAAEWGSTIIPEDKDSPDVETEA